MTIYEVEALPDAPLAASAQFHANHLPLIENALTVIDTALTIVFPPADYAHRGWRLAVVEDLARTYAPLRINAVAGDCEAAIAVAISYLEGAEGITGQLLVLVGTGAGPVLSSST